MANSNGPFGLRPARLFNGGDIRSTEYSIAADYGTKIYTGDPVQLTGTGTNIAVATAGTTDSVGVFAGCRYINEQGRPTWSHYWPANSAYSGIVALVWDDPNVIFEIQMDTLAEADVGLLVDWDDGAGSTATGMSGRQGANAGKATADKSLRILRLSPTPGNAYGAYAKAEVLFAEHALKGVIAGVGGT